MNDALSGPDRQLFNDWVRKNYGGNSRTKTITKDKYIKICALLRGEQMNSNAKFRFWVRSKGFRLLKHDRHTNKIEDDVVNGKLYVSLHAKEESTCIENFLRTNLPPISFFRKVAVVDEFYDIIKIAHIDEKGKHAGQKKTYRLVSDTYAFLPREVITFYLLNCDTCKPRIQKYGPIQSKNRQNNADKHSPTLSNTSLPPLRENGNGNSPIGRRSDYGGSVDSLSTSSAVLSPFIPSRPPSLSPFKKNEALHFTFQEVSHNQRSSPTDSLEDEIIDPVGGVEKPAAISPFNGSTSPVPPTIANNRPPLLSSHKALQVNAWKKHSERYQAYHPYTLHRPSSRPSSTSPRSEFYKRKMDHEDPIPRHHGVKAPTHYRSYYPPVQQMRSLKEYDLYRRNLDLHLVEKLNNRHYFPTTSFKAPEIEHSLYKHAYEKNNNPMSNARHLTGEYKEELHNLDYRIERQIYSHERLLAPGELLRGYDHHHFVFPRLTGSAAHY
ncbi:uncharacterized protein [Clytia hemisphaerica]|uniref:Uncharacterized protein n=1 Tax=Clytia hemisphaerica TaxID=252671 RepID=A0A7M5XHG3_9CNID